MSANFANAAKIFMEIAALKAACEMVGKAGKW